MWLCNFSGQRQGTSGPLDPSATNHTYALPPTHPDNPLMKVIKPPQQKEKQQKSKFQMFIVAI